MDAVSNSPTCTSSNQEPQLFVDLTAKIAMGDRTCYQEYCPDCDAEVTIVDEECPDCGRRLHTE